MSTGSPPPSSKPAERAAPDAPIVLPPRRSKSTPGKTFMGRFMLGHLIAYPVGFLTAVAAMPYGMVLRKKELLGAGATGASSSIIRDVAKDMALSATEAAQVQIVLEFCMWASVVTLTLVHLWTLPWAIAAARAVRHPDREANVKRRQRLFAVLTVSTFAVVGIAGAAGWIWVLSL